MDLMKLEVSWDGEKRLWCLMVAFHACAHVKHISTKNLHECKSVFTRTEQGKNNVKCKNQVSEGGDGGSCFYPHGLVTVEKVA